MKHSTVKFPLITAHQLGYHPILHPKLNFCRSDKHAIVGFSTGILSFWLIKLFCQSRQYPITLMLKMSVFSYAITFTNCIMNNNADSTFSHFLLDKHCKTGACKIACSSQVKKTHTQFTCVTCSLPVKTGKFSCVDATNNSRRIYANCLQAHVNLPEYHGYFTGTFTCGTHANLPATSRQNYLLLQAKIYPIGREKH